MLGMQNMCVQSETHMSFNFFFMSFFLIIYMSALQSMHDWRWVQIGMEGIYTGCAIYHGVTLFYLGMTASYTYIFIYTHVYLPASFISFIK